MITLLSLLIAVAQADTVCDPQGAVPLAGDLIATLAEASDPRPAAPTQRWSVTEEQVEAASCRRAGPFTAAEMESYLAERSDTGEVPETRIVNGIAFENESMALLRIFERLAGEKIFESACKKVRCALDEIFGSEVGLRSAFLLERFGVNVSPFTETDVASFTAAELDDVALALADLPPGVLPRNREIPLKRVPPGVAIDQDPEIIANSHIRVSDAWVAKKAPRRHATILHEVAHQLAREVRFDDSSLWYEAGGWVAKEIPGWNGGLTRKYENTQPGRAVSTYGLENPTEDFAETFEAYRYNPDELLRRSPEKYALLREIFFDRLEYRAGGRCDPDSGRFATMERRARTTLGRPEFVEQNLDAAFRACGAAILASLGGGGDPSLCVAEQILVPASAQALAESPWGDPALKNFAVEAYTGRAMRLSKDERQSIAARARKPIRAKLRSELSGPLERMIQEVPSEREKMDCRELARYRYQSLKPEAFDRSRTSGNQRYENLESVTTFFAAVCERAGKDPARFRAAFDQLLPE